MSRNLRIAASLAAGVVFGVGLIVSGMTDPAKVRNFLDLAGLWDPSLAFVMGGAVVVAFIGYRLSFASGAPLFAERFSLPTSTQIDLRLVAGAALFGIGWGLAGFCPGPALASVYSGGASAWIFVAAMLTGMWAARRLVERQ
ncbi:MAG: DUF6691 family protein [Alphaproteobacteria bacterium]|jgi:uncharacterized membrane protein YedE/YeeE